jgi:hypothetical protein
MFKILSEKEKQNMFKIFFIQNVPSSRDAISSFVG